MRKPISKRLRFEVFKRDLFRCQYCGASAPESILHVDHVEPVAEGGSDDILNLVTSCSECNSGKGKKRLSDSSAVSKQLAQIRNLAERREQLEMLLEWRSGLTSIEDSELDAAVQRITALVGSYFEEADRQSLRRAIRRDGIAVVLDAIEEGCLDSRLVTWEKGADKIPLSAWEKLLRAVCAISHDRKVQELKPYWREIRHIQHTVLRYSGNAGNWARASEAIRALEDAAVSGVPTSELWKVTRERGRSFTDWLWAVELLGAKSGNAGA